MQVAANQPAETNDIKTWLAAGAQEGIAADEIAIFVRSAAELPGALPAAQAAGLPTNVLDEHLFIATGHISIGTMHLAPRQPPNATSPNHPAPAPMPLSDADALKSSAILYPGYPVPISRNNS
jgi:hypothetical protein